MTIQRLGRLPIKGRRVWISFGEFQSCLVFGKPASKGRWDQWGFSHAHSTYEMSVYRKQVEYGEAGRRAKEVADSVTSPIVYAFYARETRLVKIGRTTNLMARWAQLENSAGARRQLLAIWRGVNARSTEWELHRGWLDHRVFGEWFQSEPVIADLAQMTKQAS